MSSKGIESLWVKRVKRFLSLRLKSIAKKIKNEDDLRACSLDVSYEKYFRENFGVSIKDWRFISPVLSSLNPIDYEGSILELANNIKKVPDEVFSLHFSNLINKELFAKFVTQDLGFAAEYVDIFQALVMEDNGRLRKV